MEIKYTNITKTNHGHFFKETYNIHFFVIASSIGQQTLKAFLYIGKCLRIWF